MSKPTWMLLLALSLPFATAPVRAMDETRCYLPTNLPPTVNFRVDNDLFGGQDQGYSSGAQLTLVSPNLKDYTGDPCLPAMARWLNSYLDWLAPRGFDQQNMVVSVSHQIFTPTDFSRTDLIEDDRPYAAALLVGFGYNARRGDRLRTSKLHLGMVGPAALGKPIQKEVHKLTGSEEFLGWDNQLRNEPVIMLQQERSRRFFGARDYEAWSWDAISHHGGAIGNLATYANIGAEFRFGRYLPDDFGSTPLRPAGENTAPRSEARSYGKLWRWHMFFTVDGRWVLHDVTLDGNTFRNSHSVDRKPLVGYLGYGMALTRGHWKLAFARYHSSREFEEQVESPVFGSFTVSRTL